MKEIPPFKFERVRGIVWVCDIKNSSSYLNDPNLVNDIESFFPRFYYVSKLLIEEYNGQFIKWTGDGFLAFFKVEVERDLFQLAEKVFDCAIQLSVMSNLTQMGLKPKKKIFIRHGITYEKDALFMEIQSASEKETLDIIGRDVVLAFRLSSVEASFPSITTVNKLIQRNNKKFIRWVPSHEEKLKFFKGEKYGLNQIKISQYQGNGKNDDIETFNKKIDRVTEKLTKIRAGEIEQIMPRVVQKMKDGPDWCGEIIDMVSKEFEPLVAAINRLGKTFSNKVEEKENEF